MDIRGHQPIGPTADGGARRRRRRLLGVVGLGSTVFVVLATQVSKTGVIGGLDRSVTELLDGAFRNRAGFVRGIEAVSALGDPLGLTVVVALAVGILLSGGRTRTAAFLGAAWLGQVILGSLLKDLVQRQRPVLQHSLSSPDGPSFPSGHTLAAMVLYGAVLIACTPRMSRRRRLVLTVLTVLVVAAVGSSRVLLGAHFPSDVLGGVALGTVWLAIVTLVLGPSTASAGLDEATAAEPGPGEPQS